jgi:DNA-binding transcriptional regulator YhcF (GntR family)
VNPNTAARALQALADSGIARMERCTGYFVAEDGPARAAGERRRRFFEEELPRCSNGWRSSGSNPGHSGTVGGAEGRGEK